MSCTMKSIELKIQDEAYMQQDAGWRVQGVGYVGYVGELGWVATGL